MKILRRTAHELVHHAPFTALGAVAGILVMLIIHFASIPQNVSEALFYTFHPLHVVLSALVTTALYRRHHKKASLWLSIVIGYTGSVGIATVSDAVIPYLGGSSMQVNWNFELPFIATEQMPFIGVPKWVVVNAAAVIGIAIGYWKLPTRFPHMGHVLLSTWASLFGFTAFGVTENWMPMLPYIFVFLFLAVWLPCCVSDIVYPLLWVREE
jgi:hypothetical protein